MTLVNGVPTECVAAGDRGLAYGDGVFETIACSGGACLNLERHLRRLERGCAALAITMPDRTTLTSEIRTVAGRDRVVVKVIVTRGSGGAGYTPAAAGSPTRIVTVRPWPQGHDRVREAGVRCLVADTRLTDNPRLAGVKHLNRLEQVLASAELARAAADEAVMLDTRDHVVEATRCNVFMVVDGRLVTPRIDRCGVLGVMREIILEIAPGLGFACAERRVALRDLAAADEVFLCNAIAGIWPVVALGSDRTWPVGGITRALQAALRRDGCYA